MFMAALVFSLNCHAKNVIHVTFVNPDKPGNVFWDRVTTYMQFAAEDLDIELSVLYAESRFQTPDIVSEAIKHKPKPDYLLYIYQYAQTRDVLEIAEQAKIKSFIFNTNMVEQERRTVGEAREKYKYWIGHSFPNNKNSGQQLAQSLITEAQSLHLQQGDGRHYLVALHGTRDSSAVPDYKAGLENAVSLNPNIKIVQQLHSNWSNLRAKKQTEGVLRRHPEIDIIWAGSESMAMGAIDASEKLGRKPGQDIIIGGTVSSQAGLQAVDQGKMIASIGGDTLEGAWALTQIYDYEHGQDFYTGTPITYSLTITDKETIRQYDNFFSPEYWQQVDFKQFTKRHNPQLKEVQVTPDTLVKSTRETPKDSAPIKTTAEEKALNEKFLNKKASPEKTSPEKTPHEKPLQEATP
ncbi:ABC transporter periplasmic-binding protein YtfQ [Thalassocella blandensis]|nr:ABC transporter periplasmic-binding protein YtfQ [Thalassocella blandensis]